MELPVFYGDSDEDFFGVDNRSNKELRRGYTRDAVNKDFFNGYPETRKGWHTMPWAYTQGVVLPKALPWTLDTPRGFGTVYGYVEFSDPHGNTGILLAVRNGVWRLRENGGPTFIKLPSGVRLSAPVFMLQAFDHVLMFRGEDLTTLVWDTIEDFTAGVGSFEEVIQTAVRGTDADNTYGSGTQTIPNSKYAVFFGNRVYVLQGRKVFVVGDIQDYTRYSPATHRFRVSDGSDDSLMAVAPFNQTLMILFMDQSIHLLRNVYNNLADVRSDLLTDEYGLVAKDAWAQAGKDIWFLSDQHVYTIGQALDNELQAGVKPMTDEIEGLMRRVNWACVEDAIMEYHDNKMYLAVPFDQSTYNNVVLVYDFSREAWAGYWTSDWLNVKGLVKSNYAGRRSMFIVLGDRDSDPLKAGAVVVMNDGFTDRVFSTEYDVEDKVRTRSLFYRGLEQERSIALKIDQSTWDPKFTVKVYANGVEEVEVVSDVTKDRTKYYNFHTADYNVENTNGDHATAGREDYSVELTSDGFSFEMGVELDRHAREIEAYYIHPIGSFVEVEVSNKQGRANQHGIRVDSVRESFKQPYGSLVRPLGF